MSQFPQFSADNKHSKAWTEYGFPNHLEFRDYFDMYKRQGIARAMIDRHIEKTWSSFPRILEKEEVHDETSREKEIREQMFRLDGWTRLMGADRRNRVGRYSGVLLIINDGKRFHEPVEKKMGGNLERLHKVIPLYESQLKPIKWYMGDVAHPNYGEPAMYMFHEHELGDRGGDGEPERSVQVHPDRVFIWAEGADDGSIYGEPALESGFNALITMEKISGGGGEGFWKAARGAMKLDVDPEADLQSMATMLGVKLEDVPDKMDELVKKFHSGHDASFMTQGIEATNMSFSLPIPEHFFAIALNEAAASVNAPSRVLIGNQTGERASTEDNKEWNAVCASRRERFVVPTTYRFFQHLHRLGLFPMADFFLDWDDLTAPDTDKRLEHAGKMAETNKSSIGTGVQPAFTDSEIREAAGYSPEPEFEDDDFGEDDDDPDDDQDDPDGGEE